MAANSFYNTIHLTDSELAVEKAKASGLQSIIEIVFKTNPTKEISGWQMKHFLELHLQKKVNLNSIRRSITNLKNENKLIKTMTMVMGDEGKNEHLYKLTGSSENIYKNGQDSAGDIATKIISKNKGIQGDLFNLS